MKKIYFAIFATILMLLAGCSTLTKDIQVDAATDPKVNLSAYKTYTWIGEGEILNDPEKKWKATDLPITGDIKYLIDRELRKQGLTLANREQADLGVAFFIGVDMEAQKLKKNPETKVEMLENIPEAALIVALVDNQTGYLVWVGEAVADVMENPTDEQVRERLDYAITKMIKLMSKK